MDMLKGVEQVNDLAKINDLIIEAPEGNYISEADFLASMTGNCIQKINDTLELSKKMINNLESDMIEDSIETMFNQFSTHILEAFSAI